MATRKRGSRSAEAAESGATRPFFFLLEAMLGPDLVVEEILSNIEGAPETWMEESVPRSGVIRVLGFLLLRLTEPRAAETRARLERFFADWVVANGGSLDAQPAARFLPPRQLDVILHGREGSERSAYRPNRVVVSPYEVLHCPEDSEYVRPS